MEIVRKELTADELQPKGTRYNPETSDFEVLINGDWVIDNAIDPRINRGGQLPPRITGNARCDAAASMRAKIEVGFAGLSTGLGYLGVGNELLIFLGGVLVGTGLLAGIILAAATALINIGITTIFSALTGAVYDEFECIIYCLLDENGQFSESSFAQLGAKLNDEIGGDAGVALNIVTQLLGVVGMNNAGAQGAETGDCDECDCTPCEFPFLDGAGKGTMTVRGRLGGHSGADVGVYDATGDYFYAVVLDGILQFCDVFLPDGTWTAMDIDYQLAGSGTYVQLFVSDGAPTPLWSIQDGATNFPPKHFDFGMTVTGNSTAGTGAWIRLRCNVGGGPATDTRLLSLCLYP